MFLIVICKRGWGTIKEGSGIASSNDVYYKEIMIVHVWGTSSTMLWTSERKKTRNEKNFITIL